MMKILALDLGTHTGFAHNLRDDIEIGTWLLATPKEVKEWGQNRMRRRSDPRVIRLSEHIEARSCGLAMVVFEDVQFSSSTYQTQLWSSLRGAVWLTCHRLGLIVECVPTGVLKRFATGHGGATKEMMRAAIERTGRDTRFEDDNAVDAYWIFKWAETYLSRMKA